MKIVMGFLLLLALMPFVSAVEGCYQLSYLQIDGVQGDLVITDNTIAPYTCLEVKGNPYYDGRMSYDDTIILSGWSEVEFRCVDGAFITASSGSLKPAFRVAGGWIVKDCLVKNREVGYELFDNGKISRSNATNNNYGVLAHESGEVLGGYFDNNNVGVFLTGNAAAYNVRSEYNKLGFKQEDHSYSEGSRAGYNKNLLSRAPGDSIVSGVGFHLTGNSILRSGWTQSNEALGYLLEDDSKALLSVAESDSGGFLLKNTASCNSCNSKYSEGTGIEGRDQSTISGSSSYYDCRSSSFCYGIVLTGSSSATNVHSNNNPKGISVNYGATLSNSNSCNNNFDLNNAGTIKGIVRADIYEDNGVLDGGRIVSCNWQPGNNGIIKIRPEEAGVEGNE